MSAILAEPSDVHCLDDLPGAQQLQLAIQSKLAAVTSYLFDKAALWRYHLSDFLLHRELTQQPPQQWLEALATASPSHLLAALSQPGNGGVVQQDPTATAVTGAQRCATEQHLDAVNGPATSSIGGYAPWPIDLVACMTAAQSLAFPRHMCSAAPLATNITSSSDIRRSSSRHQSGEPQARHPPWADVMSWLLGGERVVQANTNPQHMTLVGREAAAAAAVAADPAGTGLPSATAAVASQVRDAYSHHGSHAHTHNLQQPQKACDPAPAQALSQQPLRQPATVALQHGMQQLSLVGVKDKKVQELSAVGRLVAEVALQQQADLVIDFGAGKGHLAHLLADTYGLRVLALESNPQLAEAAAASPVPPPGHVAPRGSNSNPSASPASTLPGRPPAAAVHPASSSSGGSSSVVGGGTVQLQCRRSPAGAGAVVSMAVHLQMPSALAIVQQAAAAALVACQHQRPAASDGGLQQHSQHDMVDSPVRVVLVGLHACGDLTPLMLRLYRQWPHAVGLVSIGCCYNLLTEAGADQLTTIADTAAPQGAPGVRSCCAGAAYKEPVYDSANAERGAHTTSRSSSSSSRPAKHSQCGCGDAAGPSPVPGFPMSSYTAALLLPQARPEASTQHLVQQLTAQGLWPKQYHQGQASLGAAATSPHLRVQQQEEAPGQRPANLLQQQPADEQQGGAKQQEQTSNQPAAAAAAAGASVRALGWHALSLACQATERSAQAAEQGQLHKLLQQYTLRAALQYVLCRWYPEVNPNQLKIGRKHKRSAHKASNSSLTASAKGRAPALQAAQAAPATGAGDDTAAGAAAPGDGSSDAANSSAFGMASSQDCSTASGARQGHTGLSGSVTAAEHTQGTSWCCSESVQQHIQQQLEQLGLEPRWHPSQLPLSQQQLQQLGWVPGAWLMRMAMAPVLETLVWLDRWLYLAESAGESSEALQVVMHPCFDPVVSPRNVVLLSVRRPTGT